MKNPKITITENREVWRAKDIAEEVIESDSFDFLKGAKRIRVKIAMKEYAKRVVNMAIKKEMSIIKYRSDIHPNEHERAGKEYDRILRQLENIWQ